MAQMPTMTADLTPGDAQDVLVEAEQRTLICGRRFADVVGQGRASPGCGRRRRHPHWLPFSARARHVRAVFDNEAIIVHQAYGHEIAHAALAAGTFVAPFSMHRMTWIKPSFLRMMYHCGWAPKLGRECCWPPR